MAVNVAAFTISVPPELTVRVPIPVTVFAGSLGFSFPVTVIVVAVMFAFKVTVLLALMVSV